MNQQPILQFGEVDNNMMMDDMEVDREIANLALNNQNEQHVPEKNRGIDQHPPQLPIQQRGHNHNNNLQNNIPLQQFNNNQQQNEIHPQQHQRHPNDGNQMFNELNQGQIATGRAHVNNENGRPLQQGNQIHPPQQRQRQPNAGNQRLNENQGQIAAGPAAVNNDNGHQPRGTRGGNKNKRNYYRQKYNPYLRNLQNLAFYHASLVTSSIQQTQMIEDDKRKARGNKAVENNVAPDDNNVAPDDNNV